MNDMRKFIKLMEDCDETPEQGEDGECSPFTHTKDNVDMVHEDYHDEEVQRFYDMGKRELWILYNDTVEENNPEDYAALQYMEKALEMHGIGIAEDYTKEDFLIPPKDAKYDAEVEEEGEDDEEYDFDSDPLMRGGEDGLGPDGHGYDRIPEDGPGDEDDFDADPDAMVDVGDDEDYEVFDFDDEFERMMGNTHRFDEEDVMEMNALRKAAGLNEKKIISKDDVEAAGGEVRGKSSEITGGPGTTTSHRGGDEVVITKMRTFPNLKQWWKEDPEELMSMAYWRKDQLPPSDSEAWQRNWEKLKASLAKKYGEAPVEEAEGDTCSRCRKGTMEVGDTFFGPQQRCNHCGFQRAVKESTDSRDDYVSFKFDDEKAYFLVADECGEMMEFGVEDDVVLLPDQWVDQVLVLLKDHGFEKGKDFSVAGMEEDLQNGYNDRHSVDSKYGDRFPQGATSSPARDVGPAGGKHGDNPMRTPMASVDKEDEVYESYRKAYRRFRLNK